MRFSSGLPASALRSEPISAENGDPNPHASSCVIDEMQMFANVLATVSTDE
jgi:hypothetical protein